MIIEKQLKALTQTQNNKNKESGEVRRQRKNGKGDVGEEDNDRII